MPTVLIKTTAEDNLPLPSGVDKEYYLELISKEITSCLNSNAISYEKSETPNIKTDAVINLEIKNSDGSEKIPGIKILFPKGDPKSNRLSEIISENMKKIYYDPANIRVSPNSEMESSNYAYVNIIFENPEIEENIMWIRQNTDEISKEIIMSLTEFFGLPFVACMGAKIGMANRDESIRKRPNLNSEVVGSIKANTKINVLGQWEDWYIVGENNNLGYIQTKFIEI